MDRWQSLVRDAERMSNDANRARMNDGAAPVAYDIEGISRLVDVLRQANVPAPDMAVDQHGGIGLGWKRLDGHATAMVSGGRLKLEMAMEGRSMFGDDLPWRNETSVTAVLRAFIRLLDHFSPLKQVIVIRRDLKMRQGKSVSQGSHSSGEFMREQLMAVIAGGSVTLSSDEIEWMTRGMAKITVKADTFEQFDAIAAAARLKGLKVRVITDSGRTEFHGVPTVTAMAIGPTRSAYVDGITGGLTLL